MEAPYPLKMVRDWRIQSGDPEGLTMWFDPSFEVPLLGSSHLNSEMMMRGQLSSR